MYKRYSFWHKIKSWINNLDSSNIYFKERDIWWCYFGSNIGSEQDGKGDRFLRPVLIFRKFTRNTCWVIPLSTQMKFRTKLNKRKNHRTDSMIFSKSGIAFAIHKSLSRSIYVY
jgi:hypothetical protein